LTTTKKRVDVVYTRVDTQHKKNIKELGLQLDKVKDYAISQIPNNLLEISEISYNNKNNRPELLQLIDLVADNKINRVFVESPNILIGSGFDYIKRMFNRLGTEIIFVDEELQKETQKDEEASED